MSVLRTLSLAMGGVAGLLVAVAAAVWLVRLILVARGSASALAATGAWWVPYAIAGIAVPFALTAGITGWLHAQAAREAAALRREGVAVQATVVSIDRSSYVKDSYGRRRWVITAEWRDPASGTTHRFRSDGVTDDPRPRLDVSRPVTVLVHPRDPGRYLVDPDAPR